jgi:Phosphotransferase enzyme family
MTGAPSNYWAQYTASIKPESVVEAIKTINFDALCVVCEAASAVLGGSKPCAVNQTTYAYGGVNILFELCFDDGTYWLARILLPDKAYPVQGKDYVLESEAATLRFLRHKTTIPVPTVYAYDSNFGNRVGMPYFLMEAMPGKRLWGGGFSDFIPDDYKPKVYRQIADILIQLYQQPFDRIGILFSHEDTGYRIDRIFDSHHRLDPYGSFTTSLEFYHTRSCLLNHYRASKNTARILPVTVIPHEEEPEVVRYIVGQTSNCGPFFLTHPDFQITNFLFDDEFNITAVLDWSGCQTMPLESFANPPEKMIPRADKFQEGKAQSGVLGAELRAKWVERRELFLGILGDLEVERTGISLIADTMRSDRSHFAMLLDLEGVLGLTAYLPRKEVEALRVQLEEDLTE